MELFFIFGSRLIIGIWNQKGKQKNSCVKMTYLHVLDISKHEWQKIFLENSLRRLHGVVHLQK